ncbi:Exocyst complex component SEC3A, partial [Bienertia sinuspersici]
SKEKKAKFEMLKNTFVWRAFDFLTDYFGKLVDYILSNKNYFFIGIGFIFKQHGQPKLSVQADLQYKCRTYVHLLQHLKVLIANA